MGIHHLMIGTWTPPGAIFTVAFDDQALTLKLVKRTEIPKDEPISWMSFDVSKPTVSAAHRDSQCAAQEKEHLWICHEEMEQFQS